MSLKKKLVAAGLVACLAATAIGGATLAYFTDAKDASNTFTVGNVAITLDEATVTKNEENNTWAANAERTEEGEGVTYTDIYPGAYLPKDPTITNVGTYDAYVRMIVTVSSADAWKAACANHGITDLGTIFSGYVEADWSRAGEPTEADGKITYIYEYEQKLVPDATATLFTGVNIPTDFTSQEMGAIGTFTIDIRAEAIQADGFANADLAFDALDAQGA